MCIFLIFWFCQRNITIYSLFFWFRAVNQSPTEMGEGVVLFFHFFNERIGTQVHTLQSNEKLWLDICYSTLLTAILISKLMIISKCSFQACNNAVEGTCHASLFSKRQGRMFSVVRSSWNKQINQKYLPLPQHLYRKKVLLVPQPILKPLIEIKRLWIWLEREDL